MMMHKMMHVLRAAQRQLRDASELSPQLQPLRPWLPPSLGMMIEIILALLRFGIFQFCRVAEARETCARKQSDLLLMKMELLANIASFPAKWNWNCNGSESKAVNLLLTKHALIAFGSVESRLKALVSTNFFLAPGTHHVGSRAFEIHPIWRLYLFKITKIIENRPKLATS